MRRTGGRIWSPQAVLKHNPFSKAAGNRTVAIFLDAAPPADTLAADGINARVIDLYSVKPLDIDTLTAASQATGGRVGAY